MPFEIIHSDVWGPSPVLSNLGFKYFTLFIDDFTCFIWLFPLYNKSDDFTSGLVCYSLNFTLLIFWLRIHIIRKSYCTVRVIRVCMNSHLSDHKPFSMPLLLLILGMPDLVPTGSNHFQNN